jgi:type I restriction enzyme R subunit
VAESADSLNKLRTNFAFLEAHDPQLVRLGMLAERYFPDDPNTSILKLRQLAELLAQLVAGKVGVFTSSAEAQYDLLRRLQDQGILPREVGQLFAEIRRAGNAASHAISGRSPYGARHTETRETGAAATKRRLLRARRND